MMAVRRVFLFPVRLYRRFLSPYTPRTCRYYPTCSKYAIEAVDRFGVLRGSWMAFRRILRCNPLAGYGEDPVPPAQPSSHPADAAS
jgi:putative membrane protein insertion efficiency factor